MDVLTWSSFFDWVTFLYPFHRLSSIEKFFENRNNTNGKFNLDLYDRIKNCAQKMN